MNVVVVLLLLPLLIGVHALRLLECTQNGRPVDTLLANTLVECRYELSAKQGDTVNAVLSLHNTELAVSYSDQIDVADAKGNVQLSAEPAGNALVVAFEYGNCVHAGAPISLKTTLSSGESVTTVLKQSSACNAHALAHNVQEQLPQSDTMPSDNTFAFVLIYVLFVIVVGCVLCIYASPDGDYGMKGN